MGLVEDFFLDIDSQWPASDAKLPLRIIGAGALMLQTDYERVTNDGDVFETTALSTERLPGIPFQPSMDESPASNSPYSMSSM